MLLPCHGNPRVGDVAPAFARCESRASWVEKNRGDIWRHGRNWKNSAWYVESWSKATQVKLSDFGCSKKEELRSNWPIWQNVMTAIILQYTAMITIWLQYIIAMVQYNCSNQGLIHWHRIISRLILNVLILKGLVSFVKVEHLDQSLLIASIIDSEILTAKCVWKARLAASCLHPTHPCWQCRQRCPRPWYGWWHRRTVEEQLKNSDLGLWHILTSLTVRPLWRLWHFVILCHFCICLHHATIAVEDLTKSFTTIGSIPWMAPEAMIWGFSMICSDTMLIC